MYGKTFITIVPATSLRFTKDISYAVMCCTVVVLVVKSLGFVTAGLKHPLFERYFL